MILVSQETEGQQEAWSAKKLQAGHSKKESLRTQIT